MKARKILNALLGLAAGIVTAPLYDALLDKCHHAKPRHMGIGFGNLPEFRFKRNGSSVYMVSWENIRHMHYDFLTHFIRCKGVNLVWIEDLERFDDVIDFACYVRAHPQRTRSKFVINYYLQSLNDATHKAVSLLRPIVTSKHTLPMAKSFIRRHCYKELVAEEQRRQERFKCERLKKQLKGTSI